MPGLENIVQRLEDAVEALEQSGAPARLLMDLEALQGATDETWRLELATIIDRYHQEAA